MTVYLVGAGPGDPDLLTVRAHRLLSTADVVVHDRLIGPDILSIAPIGAVIHDVGKGPGSGTSQAAINTLLVELGRTHTTVVRLKGGDPLVFGRGGEEAVALASAGVAVEVVPGISAALAGPAAAGIPVTHRNVAAVVTILTGHRAADANPIEWDALARLDGTIVVLMGVATRGIIAHRLLGAGMSVSTPVAIVEWATRLQQRVTRGRLDELANLAVSGPSVIVIGAVAALDVTAISHVLAFAS